MPLFPEQLRALAYARKRGTDAPAEAIRARIGDTYAEFEALVAALPEDVARTHRSTSGWSILEVVDHLVESDRRAAGQLASLLDGQPVETPIPASLQSQDPMALDWRTLLQRFRSVHENIRDLLARTTDDIPLGAKAPVLMVVKCAGPDGVSVPVSWVEHFDWKAFSILLHAHNREHIAQVHRILNTPPEDA
jgi:hypothetical protein